MLTAPPDDHVKCPLCHTNVQNNDEVRFSHTCTFKCTCT